MGLEIIPFSAKRCKNIKNESIPLMIHTRRL